MAAAIGRSTVLGLMCMAGACRHANDRPTVATTPITEPQAGVTTWTGAFQPTSQRSGDVPRVAGGSRRTFGSVVLATVPGTSQTKVRLLFDALDGNMLLTWSVATGRCGSGTLPLRPPSTLPSIEIGSDGRGELDRAINLSLLRGGVYHVNIYRSGQGLNDVLSCANLRPVT